jgi:cholesterol transport system auxiliary component
MNPTRALLFALCLSGCSFFGKQAPLHPRFYDPEPHASGGSARPEGGKSVRLGHVVGASHLRERIAFHASQHELGFYDKRRWTERPENYVRRELARELFERRGLTQVVSGSAPTLELELTDFSELRQPKHAVRIEARVLLVDARNVRFEHTFTVELPIQASEDDDFATVPGAMGQALSQLVSQVGERVSSELPANPPPLPPPL